MSEYNIGINVLEVQGSATVPLEGASTSVAGFVIIAERGPVDEPVRVNSWVEFQKIFGGFLHEETGSNKGKPKAVGAYAIRGFFDNGGREAWVVRLSNSSKEKSATFSQDQAHEYEFDKDSGKNDAAKKEAIKNITEAEDITKILEEKHSSLELETIQCLWKQAKSMLDKLPEGLKPANITDISKTEEISQKLTEIKTTLQKLREKIFGKPSFKIEAAYCGKDNPGAWANKRLKVILQKSKNTSTPQKYNLFVLLREKDIEYNMQQHLVEQYEELTESDLFEKVNESSMFIKIVKDSNITTLALESNVNIDPKTHGHELDNGTDASTSDLLAKVDFTKFDSCEIQMLACPDADYNKIDSAITEGIKYSANRNDCIYLSSMNCEKDTEKESVMAKGKALRGGRDKSYGVMYTPWIKVTNAQNPASLVTIPPTGHVMGVYARIAAERGVWKAPAGDEAGLRGVMGITYQYNDAAHSQMVREAGVNCIRFIPGAGIVVDSSRTLCLDPRWWYVGTRRLFNYVKSSLKSGLRWVRQEPNRDTLWKQVKFNVVRPFLMDLWKQGAFGTGTPEQVFTIKCDADNNPPDKVNLGYFTLEVYFYPSRPAETIVIKVGQQDSGASTGEK